MKNQTISTLLGCTLTFLSGCQVMSGERNINQYSDDARVTTAVKAALISESSLPASRIHVETDKNLVLLSGFVKNARQKNKAGEVARQVQGVRAVENNLIVRP